MRFVLPPSRQPQSLIARVAAGAIAIVGVAALIVFGAFVLVFVAIAGVIGLIWFRWHLHKLRKQFAAQAEAPAQADPDIIEGEYVVVDSGRNDTSK